MNEGIGIPTESWDFRGDKTTELTHGVHPYPARMPPQLPRTLIDGYRDEVTFIGDPYCGSGTVLLESMRAGVPCYGTDINALATLISRVKTTLVSSPVFVEARDLIPQLKTAFDRGGREDASSERIDFMFSRHVRRQLSTIVHQMERLQNKISRKTFDIMLVSLAYTARKVSFQRWKEFKLYRIPKERRPYYRPNAYGVFLTHFAASLEQLARLKDELGRQRRTPRVKVELGDARFFNPPSKVDMIITSPPYGDSRTTVAYEEFAIPAMLWLSKLGVRSLEPKLLKPRDILSCSPSLQVYMKRIQSVDQSRARDIQHFYEDVHASISRMYQSLDQGGRLCLVVGGRTIRGIFIPMDMIVEDFAASLGFEHEAKHARTISAKTQPKMNNVATTINHEYIEVFRKA